MSRTYHVRREDRREAHHGASHYHKQLSARKFRRTSRQQLVSNWDDELPISKYETFNSYNIRMT